MLYSLGGNDKEYYDVKSSFQSQKESKFGIGPAEKKAMDPVATDTNSYKRISEINLQKINNIYTSPFFLINA